MTLPVLHSKRFRSSAGLAFASVLALLVAGCSGGEPDGSSQRESSEPASPGSAAAALERPALPLRSLPLRVLMPDGKPAAGASVRFVDTALIAPASLLRATGGEPDAEKILEVLGEEKRTDGDGQAAFETSGGPLLVSASLDRLYVMQPFAPPAEDAERLTLTLALDSSVRARAVDGDGSPVPGIPIALSLEIGGDSDRAAGAGRWIDLAVRENGGEDATVRFRDPRGGVQPADGPSAPRFGVRLAVPGLSDTSPAVFDPDAPPREVIDLVVPPLSGVVVEVLTATGQLVEMEADVVLEEHRGGGVSNRSGGPGSRLRARLSGGRATFTAVVPGTLLHVTVQPLDGTAAFEGVGPSALGAGDVATISVSMDR